MPAKAGIRCGPQSLFQVPSIIVFRAMDACGSVPDEACEGERLFEGCLGCLGGCERDAEGQSDEGLGVHGFSDVPIKCRILIS